MSKWETGILAVGLGAAIAYGIQHETRSIPHTMSEVTRLETDLSESLESVERLEGEVQAVTGRHGVRHENARLHLQVSLRSFPTASRPSALLPASTAEGGCGKQVWRKWHLEWHATMGG